MCRCTIGIFLLTGIFPRIDFAAAGWYNRKKDKAVISVELKQKLTDRFLRYAAISSQSDPEAGTVPSSQGQWELARLLASELETLGLRDIFVSDRCVVTGHLPARLPKGQESVPVVGWVAHLDTVDVRLSPRIQPRLIRDYPGGDICQNREKGLWLREKDHPELRQYLGQDLLVSDGTSVLGADNKAAIANIMVSLEVLAEHPEMEHGEIYVCFVPDEEIGLLGAKSLDLSRFPVDFAYTIDCCEEGEVVYETFHAASARLEIRGIPAHPMSAKNRLVNPAMVAVDFINLLDRAQTPEHTEKTEGFIWVTGIVSDARKARVTMAIRDHDLEKFRGKKAYLQTAVELVRAKHPGAEVTLCIEDTYGNIADAIRQDNRACIDYLYNAMEELGIIPKTIAMRGGTDGSYLSSRGILTPNYFTGAHNFHSSAEFLPLNAFENSCRLTLKLISLIAGK